MVFTGPLLYLAFPWRDIGKIFLLDHFFLFYAENIPEIYFDKFFEFTYEIEKNR